MNLLRASSFVLLAVSVLAAFGCVKKESVDSQDVTTHGMSLDLEVVNDGTHATVEAGLHVGSWESLVWARLTTGDELVLTDPTGAKRALGVVDASGKTVYGATVPAIDGVFLLDFTRAKGASALGNKIAVPPAFSVTAPTTASRKEALTFSWPAAGGSHRMEYRLGEATCLASYLEKDILGDPGKFTLNAGDLEASPGREGESCQVTLVVTRTLVTNDCCSAEFGHPSRALGRQVRTVKFTSTP
jgi:hypothetical protein